MSKTNWFRVVKSVLAAGIGVQSDKNRQYDFENGKLSHYLIVGFIATILFIVTLKVIISMILA